MAFSSISAPLVVPAFDRRNSGLIFLRWVGGPIPQPVAIPIHSIQYLQVLLLGMSANVFPVGSYFFNLKIIIKENSVKGNKYKYH